MEPTDAAHANECFAVFLSTVGLQINALFLIALVTLCVNTGFSQNASSLRPPVKKSPQSEQRSLKSIRELKLGEVIEEEIKLGAVRRYIVPLKAGEYMRVAVDPQMSGVAVQALDPAGKPIAQITVGGKRPGESLWVLADLTGDYEIRATGPNTRAPYGPYRISLEKVAQLRTASSSDQFYVKAHALLFEGNQLVAQGDKRSFDRAFADYERALELWRQLGERAEEAYTLHELGYAHAEVGELSRALDFYSQAISLWRTTQSHELDEARTLYNMGTLYSFSGKTTDALACYQRVIEIRRSMHDKGGLAYALTNLGQVYINIGEFESALKCHQEALQLHIDIENLEGQARSLSNIGGVFFRLGEFQEALNYSLQALPLRRSSGDRRGEAVTLTNIGSAYGELGEPEKAVNYQQRALSLIRQTQEPRSRPGEEAGLLDAIGRSYYDLGDYPKALDYYRQSLALRQIKEPYGQANSLTNIGNVYSRIDEKDQALAYFEQSLALRRSIGDRRGEASTLQGAGEVYRRVGEIAKARVYFEQGLALSRAIKNRFYEANLLYDIALIDQSEGRLADARSHVESALAIVESSRERVSTSELRTSLLASKQDLYELEIDLLMSSYKEEENQESMVKAFSVSEQRRARSLLDSLEQPHRVRPTVPSELVTRERNLRAALNQKAENQIKLLSGKFTQDQAAGLAKDLDKVSTDYEQVKVEIAAADPHYADFIRSSPLTLTEIQKEILDSDTVLLEYSLGKQRSYLWAVTSTDVAAYELPSRSDIERQARDLYGLLTARNQFVKFEKADERNARIAKADADYLQAAATLSRGLFGPVATKLGRKRLLIVGDGALEYLPFAALPLPASDREESRPQAYRPLIADHEITSLPSASILGVLRRELKNRKPAAKTLAVLADPVFSKDDQRVAAIRSTLHNNDHGLRRTSAMRSKKKTSENNVVRTVRDVDAEIGLDIARLPFTRQEARAILALVPRAYRFEALDFDANRSIASSPELSQYRIVHFATHGLLNATHPGLSGLIFSLVDRRGNDKNGFLPINEIFNLNLPADLVVLSGCRTGLGKEIKGEGLEGLTRGFFYAGTARVAVSLWDVDDKSTAELMARFYHAMLGKRHLSPATALREAQIAMWQSSRWQPPYYWAAFVIQGEYR